MKSESVHVRDIPLLFFILLIIFLQVLHSPVEGRNNGPLAAVIDGHVVNATSFAPVSGASIHIYPGNLSAETDFNGSFSISVPSAGNYTINASADGYISSEETIYCPENQQTHIDILLFPVGTSFENGTLFGYVVDGMTGLPVTSANISIVPGNLSAITDFRGFYAVSARGSTYYTITANATGYYNASTFVFLEPNGSTNASFFLTPLEERYSWIYGYIYDANTGTRIADASVSVSPGGNTTYSDGQGYYNFTVVGDVTYVVQAIADGYQTGSKTVQALSGKATRADISLMPVSSATSRIEGYVYDVYSLAPVQSAMIVATPGNLSAVTNSSGYFYLELAPGVNYTIRCTAEGYIENHTFALLAPDEMRQIVFYLCPEYENGRVYGKVVDITNQMPLAGALIVVEPEGVSTYTNISGEYEFLLRKGFDYRISVSHDNYTSQTHTFFLNDTELQLSFYMYPRIYNLTVNITGVVRDPAGNPVEGAEVTLRSTDGMLLKTNYTDSNGNFHFLNLPVILNYSLTISADGYVKKVIMLRSENFTSDTYTVPQALTKLDRVQTESMDYMPFIIASVLITAVATAFVVLYSIMRRR
ncbi:MAG: carboxypeptidase regulatory-like domain-containing protein [Thermoplasmata archaeon]|nr:carboxypeptidase regulatory-like domain-containing protein [Thermoplasmata archaeon]